MPVTVIFEQLQILERAITLWDDEFFRAWDAWDLKTAAKADRILSRLVNRWYTLTDALEG
jgi:hypothetical protein